MRARVITSRRGDIFASGVGGCTRWWSLSGKKDIAALYCGPMPRLALRRPSTQFGLIGMTTSPSCPKRGLEIVPLRALQVIPSPIHLDFFFPILRCRALPPLGEQSQARFAVFHITFERTHVNRVQSLVGSRRPCAVLGAEARIVCAEKVPSYREAGRAHGGYGERVVRPCFRVGE